MSGEMLVVAEHFRGSLRPVTREAVRAAASLRDAADGRVAVLLVAADLDPLIEQLALDDVDEILAVPVEREPTTDTLREVLARIVGERGPRAVIAGQTVDGMGYGAAVAAGLSLGFAADVVDARVGEGGGLVVQRELYGGRVLTELELPGPSVLLLRPTTWPEAQAGAAPAVSRPSIELGPARVRHREHVEPPVAEVDITKAEVILAVGRGIGEQGNVALYEELAERLGATLAASRPLVDAGWLPASRQVGQSGNTVKPRLYLAFGISGAVQHLAGMKGAATIVAVNTDPEAPIFGIAHYGALADVEEVAEELAKLA